ncbi:riboflavin kinase [Agrilus planipennis]|uniref:Riboflavin kinase n=1 Tax=Agrilus planipennis TaxID=224129 RepID=A0A1W4XMP8_AGRPL|nr:riboflavin kinase [Agrilus planipennis]
MFIQGLPHFSEGKVIKGFGRGSKELGIPTANFPDDVVKDFPKELGTGVYFGFASVNNGPVYKMVMSVGWNPYYKNVQKSMETHILHLFEEDFYGKTLKTVILGFIREMKDFSSLDELIAEIRNDIKVAETELEKPEYVKFINHDFFAEK